MTLLTYDECCMLIHKYFGGNYGGLEKERFIKLVRAVEAAHISKMDTGSISFTSIILDHFI